SYSQTLILSNTHTLKHSYSQTLILSNTPSLKHSNTQSLSRSLSGLKHSISQTLIQKKHLRGNKPHPKFTKH
ncbi:MAG: hypothetical protein RBR10_12210, partial [Bacteroidales bacterium]|nr:hypothetical protein [Bacteroidales bacterium]